MAQLKGYAGVCKSCSAPHIHYGEIPKSCVKCGGAIDFHGQITPLGMLLPGLYHAVQDRRYFKRTGWEIYDSISSTPIGSATNIAQLRRASKSQVLPGLHPKYLGINLIEFMGNDKVSIRWFITNRPIDLEGI